MTWLEVASRFEEVLHDVVEESMRHEAVLGRGDRGHDAGSPLSFLTHPTPTTREGGAGAAHLLSVRGPVHFGAWGRGALTRRSRAGALPSGASSAYCSTALRVSASISPKAQPTLTPSLRSSRNETATLASQ